jgi:hypothetical protein
MLPIGDFFPLLPSFLTSGQSNPQSPSDSQIHPQTPDVCSQSESQRGIQPQGEEPSNVIHPDRFSRESAHADDAEFGSSGRIRTYDQSVNPDSVGTLPLSCALDFSKRSRIRRADFQFLIWRSRRVALERSGCSSVQAKVHGPFLRVNFPPILSVRL